MRLLPQTWFRRSADLLTVDLIADDEAEIATSSQRAVAEVLLLDALFGEGFVMPGGAEEIARLAAPMKLSAGQSVLLIGAGTGGPVLSLLSGFGVSVTGFEATEAYARVAADRIRRASVGARASVAVWSPAKPVFKPPVFDHVLALLPLGAGTAAAILHAIVAALKPGGHLLLLEIVAAPISPIDDKLLTTCLTRDRDLRAPPRESEVTALIAGLGLETLSVDDVTARYQRLTMAAWARLMPTFERRPDAAIAAALVAEAERWAACADLMRAGQLRLMAWHATQSRDPAIDVGAMSLEIMLAVQFRDWSTAISVCTALADLPGHDAEVRRARGFIKDGIARDGRDLPDEIRCFQ